MFEIFILSIVQGVTEFVPISSSSHLIIISELINFENKSLSIDVSLHLGSFIAVLTYFRKDIFDFVNNRDLLFKILVSSIPVIIAGFMLVQTGFIESLRKIEVIAWATLIFGLLLYYSDKFQLKKNIESNFSFKSALLIGLLQIFSLIPGVSRSGITITAARLLNFKRYDAAKISFLLSIPTLGAVSLYGLKNIKISKNFNFSMLNISSIFFSFIFSIVTIKFFLVYVKKFSLTFFVAYRIILGLFLLYFAYL